MARVEAYGGAIESPVRGWGRSRTSTGAAMAAPVTTTRAVMSNVSLWSVTKLALAFWTCVGVAIAAATALAWTMLRAMGIVTNVQHFVDQLTSSSFRVSSGQVLMGSALAIASFVIVATMFTIMVAAFYNALARATGGLRVEVELLPQQTGFGTRNNGHADGSVVL